MFLQVKYIMLTRNWLVMLMVISYPKIIGNTILMVMMAQEMLKDFRRWNIRMNLTLLGEREKDIISLRVLSRLIENRFTKILHHYKTKCITKYTHIPNSPVSKHLEVNSS